MSQYKFHNDCQSSVLTYEQVKRLDYVMDQTVPIHGRGNFPTLYVKLKQLIRLVKHKLQNEHQIEIQDVRLNGGASNYVLAPENSQYNDLDLILGTDLSDESRFDVIRDVVLECLKEFMPKEQRQQEEEHFKQHNPQYIISTSTTTNTTTTTNNNNNNDDNDTIATSTTAAFDGPKDNHDNQPKSEASMSCYSSPTPLLAGDVGDNNIKLQDNLIKSDTSAPSETTLSEVSRSSSSRSSSSNNDNHTHQLQQQTGPDVTSQTSGLSGQAMILVDSHSETSRAQDELRDSTKLCFQQQPTHQMPPSLTTCAIKEAYVHKMVKVNDDDRWSLISLGVQPSEANCGAQVNCSFNHMQSRGTGGCNQHHQHQLAVNLGLPFGVDSNIDDKKCAPVEQTDAQATNENNPASTTQTNDIQHQLSYLNQQHQQYQNQPIHYQHHSIHHQHHHHHHHHHHHQHLHNHHPPKKQFPNSIELKFVDRMRRKFEFSVDSFQIILDSLIQFYDYAPQPAPILQRRASIDSHSSSSATSISGSSSNKVSSSSCLADGYSAPQEHQNNSPRASCKHNFHPYLESKSCNPMSSGTPGYYQLPIATDNSPSVASSSGCSSSSSVVSSSSSSTSSLSCDEDNEDLYCEAEGSSSSSASSTSSLLGSNASSLISSDVPCTSEFSTQKKSEKSSEQSVASNATEQQKQSLEGHINTRSDQDLMTADSGKSVSMKESDRSVEFSTLGYCCQQCLGRQHNPLNDIYHFEIDNRTPSAVISENFYPTVIGRSEYGSFKEALYHLERKLIATRSPEEIRGGGLLKYCNLLVKNYKPTNVYQIRTLERYMCSRFFIDFSDLNQQQAKLESYLANHFSDDPVLKFDYLTILHNVVQRSTVCLMNHELRLTLNMIKDLAYKLNEQQQQNQHQLQQLQSHNNTMAMPQNQSAQKLASQNSTQHQQSQHYQQQKPVMIQSGIYRVKLVNYTLAKPNCLVEQ